jgi:glycine C-acetyltransferase
VQVVKEYVQRLSESGLEPDEYICHTKKGNLVDLEEAETGVRRTVLTFCTNDVLGLVQNQDVQQAAIDAIVKYGTSNSSCSVLSGRIHLHRELEDEISEFKHLPHTQLFLNAWMAMQALMDAFCHLAIPVPNFQHTRETLILTDVLNHGCIVSAIANAGTRSGKLFGHSPRVRVRAYRHCDMNDLSRKLQRYSRPDDRIMVVSDAVFSMDGDIAPLPEMIDIMANYPGSVLVMDEAHASGALGATGRGIYEHFGITPQDAINRGVTPLIMTTFSKFAASAGAAISSHIAELKPLLNYSPTSIGTISLPPPVAAAALESIRQVRKNPSMVQRLQESTKYLRDRLVENGFEPVGETNVIPVILPAELNPKLFARVLMNDHGIWVSPDYG